MAKLCTSCFLPVKESTTCSVCGKPLHKDCAIKEGGTFFCDVCYTVKSEEVNTNPDFEIPSVIRRSYIETYKSCPYKFYLNVIKGIGDEQSVYAQLGIDLHELFDKASKDRSFTSDQMLQEFNILFSNYPESFFKDQQFRDKMYSRGLNSIDTFYDVIKDMPKPYATEQTIQFSIGEGLPLVQTTSDRINMVDNELEMIDWKTGVVMVGQKLSSDLQAPLYIYGVREHFKLPIRKFTFYYLDENKTRVFERVNDDEYVCQVNKRKYYINLTDAIREVKSIFNKITKGDFNIPRETKGMFFTCKMCDFKEKGMCKGAELESWSQYNKTS